MVDGIYRKGKRGVPGETIQDETSDRNKQNLAEAVGTLQAAFAYSNNHPDRIVVAV